MIKAKEERVGIEIDLTGPDGNAFALIGLAGKLSRSLDLDGKKIQAEMMNGNYEHLIEVFDREFGAFVTLYR
jgi:hypothetical protein